MKDHKGGGLHMVTFILLAIGGLNWLLVGLFNWDIGMLFGEAGNIVSKIIYILVGLSAVYELFTHKKNCKNCASGAKPAAAPSQPDQDGDHTDNAPA